MVPANEGSRRAPVHGDDRGAAREGISNRQFTVSRDLGGHVLGRAFRVLLAAGRILEFRIRVRSLVLGGSALR